MTISSSHDAVVVDVDVVFARAPSVRHAMSFGADTGWRLGVRPSVLLCVLEDDMLPPLSEVALP